MRARNIKPSLFKNEILGTADPLLTILFEGLWCEADRDGRLEDRPLRLKAEILPYRHDADIDGMLNWLVNNGFIARFEARSTKVIQVLKFCEHQRPHNNEVASVLPPMDGIKHDQGNKSARPRKKALRSDSPSLIPDSGYLIPDPLMVPSEPVERERSTPLAKPPDPKASGMAESINRVFDHWRTVHHHDRAALDDKRKRLIREALKHYSEADLCQSISGYLNSPHHMGRNDRATVYTDLELLLRDSGQIDAGLKFYAEPPRTDLSTKTRANVAAIADWKPPELRNAGQ